MTTSIRKVVAGYSSKVRIAAYEPEWAKGKTFKNPETGHDVHFGSLPDAERNKLLSAHHSKAAQHHYKAAEDAAKVASKHKPGTPEHEHALHTASHQEWISNHHKQAADRSGEHHGREVADSYGKSADLHSTKSHASPTVLPDPHKQQWEMGDRTYPGSKPPGNTGGGFTTYHGHYFHSPGGELSYHPHGKGERSKYFGQVEDFDKAKEMAGEHNSRVIARHRKKPKPSNLSLVDPKLREMTKYKGE